MINEEEKKAINYLKNFTKYNKQISIDENKINGKTTYQKDLENRVKNFETVLNLITKLQKENEEKDKQIDLMAGEIEYAGCIKKVWKCDQKNCKDCIKQYFKKLAKESRG